MNRNKPVEQISVAKKPERQIPTGQRFSIKKTFVVPTGKIFASSITKVDNEPTNGSNADITNQYECEQTLDGFKEFCSDEQAMTSDHNSSELGIHDHSNEPSNSKMVPKFVPPADKTATSQQKLDLVFGPLYDEFFNAGTSSVNKSSSPIDNSKQQDTQPTTNNIPTT
ncbi:hypothetical protein Tco_0542802 [Tanacetum coccineum]